MYSLEAIVYEPEEVKKFKTVRCLNVADCQTLHLELSEQKRRDYFSSFLVSVAYTNREGRTRFKFQWPVFGTLRRLGEVGGVGGCGGLVDRCF
jgi:hypothetical protein